MGPQFWGPHLLTIRPGATGGSSQTPVGNNQNLYPVVVSPKHRRCRSQTPKLPEHQLYLLQEAQPILQQPVQHHPKLGLRLSQAAIGLHASAPVQTVLDASGNNRPFPRHARRPPKPKGVACLARVQGSRGPNLLVQVVAPLSTIARWMLRGRGRDGKLENLDHLGAGNTSGDHLWLQLDQVRIPRGSCPKRKYPNPPQHHSGQMM